MIFVAVIRSVVNAPGSAYSLSAPLMRELPKMSVVGAPVPVPTPTASLPDTLISAPVAEV